MERLKHEQSSGLTAAGIHKFGILFLTLGILGRSVLQNRLLGMGADPANLLDAMMNMPNGMLIATLALILQMVETCAVPIFCFLLVEGVVHTSNFKQYILRILTLAVITEIPYNLAYNGRLLDFGSRNPVFALFLGLVLIHFYLRYAGKTATNIIIKILVTLAAAVWASMLRIDHGICCVLIVSALWVFRKKPLYRNIVGCSATILCTLFSMYYLVAPMSFMVMHFYNGERGDRSQKLEYLSYPLILSVIGIAAYILL